jgi:hypothetical protein
MGLSWYELQRERRERAFQKRVLSAIEKRDQNVFLSILNSAFFLWLLSAIFLTIGGVYFTTYQDCNAKANAGFLEGHRLTAELLDRKRAMADLTANAKSIDDIKKTFKTIPYVFAQFKDASFAELLDEFGFLRMHIEVVGKAPQIVNDVPVELTDPGPALWEGEVPPNLSDNMLEPIKHFLTKSADEFEDQMNALMGPDMEANCTLPTLWKMRMGKLDTKYILMDYRDPWGRLKRQIERNRALFEQ